MNKEAEPDDDARIDSAPSQGLKKRTGLPPTRRAPLRVNLSLLPSAQELIGVRRFNAQRRTGSRWPESRALGTHGEWGGAGGGSWPPSQALSESASIAPSSPGKK